METPSKMPDATATKAITEMTVGIIAPWLRRRRANVIPSQQTGLSNHEPQKRLIPK